MTKTTLSPLDTRWLAFESKGTPMHTGCLAIFKKPAKADADFLQTLVHTFRSKKNVGVPWNQKLTKPFKLTRIPRMAQDRDMDLGYHFRHSALPAPGGEKELGILVSRLHSLALDKRRPLWECHLIEGLENNRFAIYMKIHPCILKGGNPINTVMSMLSSSANNKELSPLWTIKPEQDKDQGNKDVDLGEIVSTFSSNVLSVGKAAKAIFDSPTTSFFGLKAPRSYLNKTTNSQRRFATQQYDLARIETLSKAADCSINTIIAYLCSSALRRFFKEYNALPVKPLMASAPLNLTDYVQGNNKETLATIRISLATDIADPVKRLKTITKSVQDIKAHLDKLPKDTLSSYAILSSAPLLAGQIYGLGRLVPNMFNVGISSLIGSEKPLYLHGAKLEAIHPMAHLMQNSALSIDCVSYAGTMNIGITGARDTLPRIQRIALYMDQALAALEDQLSNTKGEAA
jgi:WS/DGAT/MGAT family acyltransferase